MKRVLVITLAALAACSGGGGGGDPRSAAPTGPTNPGSPGPPAQTASVAMRSTEQGDGYGGGTVTHAFSPSEVRIARSGTVTWTNNSGYAHSVTFTAAAGAPNDVPAFDAGAVSRTFQTAGSFSYRCSQHAGMSGTVVVQ